MSTTKALYHYPRPRDVEKIAASGQLRPANQEGMPFMPDVVWLTANSDIPQPWCSRTIQLPIEVNPRSVHRWQTWVNKHIGPWYLAGLKDTMIEKGSGDIYEDAMKNWFIALKPIPVNVQVDHLS